MEESKEITYSRAASENEEFLPGDPENSSLRKDKRKDEHHEITSYDLLKNALIKKGLPGDANVDEIVPDSPRGKLSHEVMFGDCFKNLNREEGENPINQTGKISKEREDEIALITGK